MRKVLCLSSEKNACRGNFLTSILIIMANEIITTKDVEDKVIVVRGRKVLLDRDVAALYGVETKRVNEAVRNNIEKFPDGYIIELTDEESSSVRSKISTIQEMHYGKHSKYNYKAFTERGLYMLATILKSKNAVMTSIAIINTFTQVREMARKMEEMQHAPDGESLQKELLKKSGELMGEIIGQNLSTRAVETEIELNFAVVKIRHKIIRGGKEE